VKTKWSASTSVKLTTGRRSDVGTGAMPDQRRFQMLARVMMKGGGGLPKAAKEEDKKPSGRTDVRLKPQGSTE
jgi:hypothetical protein